MKTLQGRNKVAGWMVAAVAVAAVSSPVNVTAQSCAPNAAPVTFKTIEHAVQSPYATGTVFLARSAKEWTDAMNYLAESGGLAVTPGAAPEIDWSQQAVLVVALGECPTYGFDVEIAAIWKEGQKAVVEITYSTPGPEGQIQSVTSPYHMVSFDRTGLGQVELCYDGPALMLTEVGLTTGTPTDQGSTPSNISWSNLKTRFGL